MTQDSEHYYQYSYNSDGVIESVEYPDQTKRTYIYADGGLTAIENERGIVPLDVSYGSDEIF